MGVISSKLCPPQADPPKPIIVKPEVVITKEDEEKIQSYKVNTKVKQTMIQFGHYMQIIGNRNTGERPCRSKEDIFNLYEYIDGESTGEGSFGSVFHARLKSDPEKQFAIKVIDLIKQRANQNLISMFLKEIELLKTVDHPNIIKFHEVYDNNSKYYLVTEFCKGGNLEELIKSRKDKFSEAEIRTFMWQIVLSINYLHQRKIAHRDIKPENFMIGRVGGCHLKLIDLGLGASFAYSGFDNVVGTPGFMAPEVYQGNYDEKCDIWAIGVILYLLMTKVTPFGSYDIEEIRTNTMFGDYNVDLAKDAGYSPEMIDLLDKLLEYSHHDRISALDTLKHSFFAQKRDEIKQEGMALVTKDLLQNIKSYSVTNTFQKEMIGLMVQAFNNEKEFRRINSIFMVIDDDFSGTIGASELKRMYDRVGVPLEESDIEHVLETMHHKDQPVITLSGLQGCLMFNDLFYNEKKIRILFEYLDCDRSQFIDTNDIKNCFRRFGRELSDDKCNKLIQEVDVLDVDNKISYQEFKSAFFSRPKNN